MPCYLDQMVDRGKRIGRAGPLWCHLIADTLDELHIMAAQIGLLRAWFQISSPVPHYDIGSESIRQLAIQMGAIDCSRYIFVQHLQRIREERRK